MSYKTPMAQFPDSIYGRSHSLEHRDGARRQLSTGKGSGVAKGLPAFTLVQALKQPFNIAPELGDLK